MACFACSFEEAGALSACRQAAARRREPREPEELPSSVSTPPRARASSVEFRYASRPLTSRPRIGWSWAVGAHVLAREPPYDHGTVGLKVDGRRFVGRPGVACNRAIAVGIPGSRRNPPSV
eukprot:3649478-Rhodomonas_salina.6